MPTAAFAAQNYELWVNNEQITSEHLTVDCGTGTAVYDPSANTLTLTNAEITTGCAQDWLYSGIISRIDGLNIILNGTNSITNTGGEGISTYDSRSQDLTISGSGTLTISQDTAYYGYGVYCTGNLTVEGTTLDITSASSGLWADEDMLIKNSNVTINAVAVDTNVMGQIVKISGNGLVTNTGTITVTNSSISASSALMAAILLGNDTVPGALVLNSGSLELSGVQGIYSNVNGSSITLNGGDIDITATDKTVTIEDVTYNNQMQLISGTLSGTSCKIYKEPSISPITLPVYTIESAKDTDYVLREDLTAVFTPSVAVTASDLEDSKSLKIDYYNPMQNPTGLESGYTKLVEYRVFFSELEYAGDTLQGTITIPLPDGCDASTAKIVGGVTATTSTATTVSFPLTLDVDQGSGSVSTDLMVEYKDAAPAHTHSWASEWTTNATYHWHECTAAGCDLTPNTADADKDGYGAHVYDNDQDTTCNTCGYVRTVTPHAPEIIEGMNSQWTQGSNKGLRFKSDADHNDFLRVEVNGNILSTDMYTVSSDSTIVVLKSSYLDTLTTGKYTIGIVSTTGTATTNFEIVAAVSKTNPNTSVPQTGDNSTAWPWIALLFVSGVALAASGINRHGKEA